MNDKDYLDKLLSWCKRNDNGCLIFSGAKIKGHGRMRYHGRMVPTHRLLMILKGHITLDNTLQVLHKNFVCKSKAYCEEEHLYIGTHKDNIGDLIETGYKPFSNREIVTHCPKGHEYTEENTRVENNRGKIMRHCRECHRIRERERSRIKQLNKINSRAR